MGKLPVFSKCLFSVLIFVFATTSLAVAQTASLSLASAVIGSGSSASLNLSLSGSAGPASLEWTLTYPSASVSALSVTPGAALTAAGKSLTCSASAGNYKCVAAAMNSTGIANGVVATVVITPSISLGTVNTGIANPLAATAAGGSLVATATGGTLTVSSTTSLSSFTCSPSSLTTPGTSSCTASLSGPAPSGGVTVTVGSNNSSLTVPSSVVVAAGSTSATFNASASSVTAGSAATITASFGTASLKATLNLMPPSSSASPVLPNSLACVPSSLAPAGSSTCTLILSGLAPTGGAAVSLTSGSSSLTTPASITVPAGSSSTTFTATAAAVTAAQASTITAALGGSSVTNSLVLNPAGGPANLMVGRGQTYASPCAALTAAADGSTISIDAAGTYAGDVCTVAANNITVKGIHGRPLINAAGLNSGGAAWLFQGNNITLDTVEVAGAASAGHNAAAILMTGRNLSVLNSSIHDNQAGLVTGASANSQILIQATEFNHNGFGDGLTHNIDVNSAARFTMQYSYSHNANAGDLVKTQASENYLLFNRLTSEQGTTSSEVDLTHGGRSFLIGNLIEKGSSDSDSTAVGYMLGGASASNPSTELYVVNNTLVSDKSSSVNFLNIGATDSTPAIVTNNIFYGAGVASTQANSVLTANLTSNPLFVNQAAYDYHLSSGSPAIGNGAAPGSANGLSLVPGYQYLDPSCGQVRTLSGAIDIGAYEFGGAGAPLYCAMAAPGINLNPSTVNGGQVTTSNTVTLSVPAPASGAVVTLTSSNPAAAAVPASITVPSGAVTGTFSITTTAVTAPTGVTISASYSGLSQSATLTVMPSAAVLSGVQCAPSSISSGAVSACTVNLTSAAPAGGVIVNLSDNSSWLTVPASISIPAGSSSATFNATAGTIASNQSVTVTATLSGISKTATLTLLGPSALASFVCSPTSMRSASTSSCVITLKSAAPAGGSVITVSSGSSLLAVPASVTVPAEATSVTFTVKTGSVEVPAYVTVTAKMGGSSLSVKFSLSH